MATRGQVDLDRGFAAVKGAVRGRALRAATLKAGAVIRDQARANAPVRTGKLKRNIEQEVEVAERERVVVRIGTTKDAFYGHLVEFGTSSTSGRPFLRPALDEKVEEATRALGRELWAEIERSVRRGA